jgi:metal-dependent amidase/aminoacylase/carboxypeptidase family protein
VSKLAAGTAPKTLNTSRLVSIRTPDYGNRESNASAPSSHPGKHHTARRRLPDVFNDAGLAQRAAESIRRVLGPERTRVYEGTVPYFGEDFAFYQKQVPGVLFFLGVSNPAKGIAGQPHAPFYQADDDAIQAGAHAMAGVLLEFITQGTQ